MSFYKNQFVIIIGFLLLTPTLGICCEVVQTGPPAIWVCYNRPSVGKETVTTINEDGAVIGSFNRPMAKKPKIKKQTKTSK